MGAEKKDGNPGILTCDVDEMISGSLHRLGPLWKSLSEVHIGEQLDMVVLKDTWIFGVPERWLNQSRIRIDDDDHPSRR